MLSKRVFVDFFSTFPFHVLPLFPGCHYWEPFLDWLVGKLKADVQVSLMGLNQLSKKCNPKLAQWFNPILGGALFQFVLEFRLAYGDMRRNYSSSTHHKLFPRDSHIRWSLGLRLGVRVTAWIIYLFPCIDAMDLENMDFSDLSWSRVGWIYPTTPHDRVKTLKLPNS